MIGLGYRLSGGFRLISRSTLETPTNFDYSNTTDSITISWNLPLTQTPTDYDVQLQTNGFWGSITQQTLITFASGFTGGSKLASKTLLEGVQYPFRFTTITLTSGTAFSCEEY